MERSRAEVLAQIVEGRRSVRRFTGEAVSPEEEDALLEAFRWAPSGGNVQPWHVVRVRQEATRRRIAAAALGQSVIARADLVLVVCVDQPRARQAYGERGVELYGIQDTAAATQNLLLMAEALGLGACWVGAFKEEEVARILELDRILRPVALVALGRPVRKPSAPSRRDLEEVTSSYPGGDLEEGASHAHG